MPRFRTLRGDGTVLYRCLLLYALHRAVQSVQYLCVFRFIVRRCTALSRMTVLGAKRKFEPRWQPRTRDNKRAPPRMCAPAPSHTCREARLMRAASARRQRHAHHASRARAARPIFCAPRCDSRSAALARPARRAALPPRRDVARARDRFARRCSRRRASRAAPPVARWLARAAARERAMQRAAFPRAGGLLHRAACRVPMRRAPRIRRVAPFWAVLEPRGMLCLRLVYMLSVPSAALRERFIRRAVQCISSTAPIAPCSQVRQIETKRDWRDTCSEFVRGLCAKRSHCAPCLELRWQQTAIPR